MLPDIIVDLARQVHPKTERNHITALSGGFSSQAYKVDSGQEPFVLLVAREGGVSPSNYAHAYVVLTLLQNHGLQYAPRPLWLKDDHQALAISFFDGVASDEFNFKQHSVDTERLAIKVIDCLLDTAVITLDEYTQLAEKFNVSESPIYTGQDAARDYGTAWFEIVKKSCPDADIVNWLAPRVRRSVAMAANLDDHKPVLSHGDPSNPNILIRADGSFMLIDWESARFHTAGPEFLVAYTTHLTNFMRPYRQNLITHVARRLTMSVDELTRKVSEYRRYSEVFDVNWAAMMMAKVNAHETSGDINHFRTIARKRIKIYEASFGSD